MGRKIVAQIIILIVLALTNAYAAKDDIKAGPFYSDKENTLEVVVEYPGYIVPPVASQFLLMIDKQKVVPADAIKPFKLSGKHLAIVLCVDVSGSMGQISLEKIKGALRTFIAESRPEDLIVLISFTDTTNVHSGFNDPRDHLEKGVDDLMTPESKNHKTYIYKALDVALKRFDDPNLPLRRRVIIISDGEDEGNPYYDKATVRKFRKKGVTIDAVVWGETVHATGVLRFLVDETGGQLEHARSDNRSVEDALIKIYNILQTLHKIVYFNYERDPSGRKTHDAQIQLTLPGEASTVIAVSTPIPRPKTRTSSLWMMGSAGLVIIGIVVSVFLFLTKFKGETKTEDEPDDQADNEIPPPVNKVDSVVPVPAYDATRIGGCLFPEPAPGSPAAIIIGVSGNLANKNFPIEKELFSIGADDGNDLCIADDDYLSGEHAYLRYQQGLLFVHDSNSRNGTTVNEVEVTDMGRALDIGDRIRVGQSAFVIEHAPH